MMDEWKDIEGYEGYYQVNKQGQVKSLQRTVIRSNGRSITFPEKILKGTVSEKGYVKVSLSKDNSHTKQTLHRIVMNAFVPNPDPSIYNHINHIDENKQNNNLTNLEWSKQADNVLQGQGVYYTITDPQGNVYNIQGLSKFCRERGLDTRMFSRLATKTLSPLSGEANGWNCEYANGIRTVGVHRRPKRYRE